MGNEISSDSREAYRYFRSTLRRTGNFCSQHGIARKQFDVFVAAANQTSINQGEDIPSDESVLNSNEQAVRGLVFQMRQELHCGLKKGSIIPRHARKAASAWGLRLDSWAKGKKQKREIPSLRNSTEMGFLRPLYPKNLRLKIRTR
ncbi:hypothetical protein HY439_02515 [Candidatus Microgenomates bacterium]|nr:hypothetical protein [Candidatus Microgenomates bacterium]